MPDHQRGPGSGSEQAVELICIPKMVTWQAQRVRTFFASYCRVSNGRSSSSNSQCRPATNVSTSGDAENKPLSDDSHAAILASRQKIALTLRLRFHTKPNK